MSSVALSNVKRMYWITAFSNMWFVAGSWLYFYRIFMDDRQIGILDGVAFGIGFLAEIPSGALADLIGRKRLIIAGLVLMAGGMLLHGVAQEYVHILIAQTMLTVGWAFTSGSDDALVYDSLKKENKEKLWPKIVNIKYQILVSVSIVSFIIGAFLYNFYYRLPFLLEGILAIPPIVLAFGYKEVVIEKSRSKTRFSFLVQIKDGMKYLLNKKMVGYVVIGLVVLGVGYVFEVGVLRPLLLDSFGYGATGQSIIIALSGAVSVVVLSQMEKIKAISSEKKLLFAFALLMTVSVGLSSVVNGVLVGGLMFVIISVSYTIMVPWLNDIVQKNTVSSHRATSLSTLALIQKTPYLLLAPVAGIMTQNGNFDTFLLWLSIVMFAALIIYAVTSLLGSKARKGASN